MVCVEHPLFSHSLHAIASIPREHTWENHSALLLVTGHSAFPHMSDRCQQVIICLLNELKPQTEFIYHKNQHCNSVDTREPFQHLIRFVCDQGIALSFASRKNGQEAKDNFKWLSQKNQFLYGSRIGVESPLQIKL